MTAIMTKASERLWTTLAGYCAKAATTAAKACLTKTLLGGIARVDGDFGFFYNWCRPMAFGDVCQICAKSMVFRTRRF